MNKILTIAGSDSGGGAGIQADLKTITMLGAYGASVITAVTAQNTLGVQGVYSLSNEAITQQLDSVCQDIAFDGVKTGMLSDPSVVLSVAQKIKTYQLKHLVVDPVMVASSGDVLLQSEAVQLICTALLPLAELVTPNIHEAAILAGKEVNNLADMKVAAQIIYQYGCQNVLVKGGHLEGEAVDLLFDGAEFHLFRAPRVATQNTHGTGCTLSAAIATFYGQGLPTIEAIDQAKAYLTKALIGGAHLVIGHGHGPVLHNFLLSNGVIK